MFLLRKPWENPTLAVFACARFVPNIGRKSAKLSGIGRVNRIMITPAKQLVYLISKATNELFGIVFIVS